MPLFIVKFKETGFSNLALLKMNTIPSYGRITLEINAEILVMVAPLMLFPSTGLLLSDSLIRSLCPWNLYNTSHMDVSSISLLLTHLHHVITATCLLERCPVNSKV